LGDGACKCDTRKALDFSTLQFGTRRSMVQIHSPRPFLRTNNLPYTHIVDRRLVSGQEVRGQEREQVGVECTSRVAPQDRSSACQVRANTSETQSNAIVSGDGWRERCKENRNETLFLFSFLQTRNAKSHARQLQVVCLVGTAMPETQLCSFGLHRSLLRDFGSCPSCNVERCMKGKCPSWPGGEEDLVRPLSRAPGCGVHRRGAKTLDRRSGRIRRRVGQEGFAKQ